MKTKPDDNKPKVLVWMVLEMTGLDPKKDKIIEIACLATDWDLNVIASGPDLAIHWPKRHFDQMDEWCTEHHGLSGLTQRCLDSKIKLKQAEQETLAWVRALVPAGTVPLCGNSIHQDRKFLADQMPELEAYFHYRNIDVSTVKELVKRWYPKLGSYKKAGKHQALDDIIESIEELRFYRQQVFIP